MSTKRILLVDYDSRNLTRHRELLEGAGFQVTTCGDGISAIDKFKALAPDLVLLSAMLPKMHGFEVCSKIRKLPGGEKIPVVIITDVYKGKRYRVDAIHKYGATEYIEQPIEDANLLQVLKTLVQQNGRGSEKIAQSGPLDLDERTVAFSRDLLFSMAKEEAPLLPPAVPEKKTSSPEKSKVKDDVSKKLEASLADLNLPLGKSKAKSKPAPAEKKPAATISRNASSASAGAPLSTKPAQKQGEPPPTLILKKQDPASGFTFTSEDLFTDVIESVERELQEQKAAASKGTVANSKAAFKQPAPPVEQKSATAIAPEPEGKKVEKESSGQLFSAKELSEIVLDLESIEPELATRESSATSTANAPPGADLHKTPEGAKKAPEPGQMEGTNFGQYLLLSKIATGGMAELYKAKRKGVEGFEKILAIKRILPHMSDHEEFVNMFVDEAKLAAQLTHQNICQIFDLGKIDNSYYITMEFVHGKDLRAILKTARNAGKSLPVELAILVTSKICSALDYAHRKVDTNKQPLNLVHRDVSPQNILISYEGEVKLVDFGIAKATNKVHVTQDGTLKGKLLYMSPEQAWGRSVDRRADIFSVGLVLYEMLSGKPQFFPATDTEVALLERVREARITPIREVNPNIPVELERIVSKALKKSPDERYQTAAELQKDLDGLFYSEGYNATTASLANFVRSLFSQEWGQEIGSRETMMLDKEISQSIKALASERAKQSEAGLQSAMSEVPMKPASISHTIAPATENRIEPGADVEASDAAEGAKVHPLTRRQPETTKQDEPVSQIPRINESPILSMSEPEKGERNWLTAAFWVTGLAIVVGIIAYLLFRPESSPEKSTPRPTEKNHVENSTQTVLPPSVQPITPSLSKAAKSSDVAPVTVSETEQAKRDLQKKQEEEKKLQLQKEEEQKKAAEQKKGAELAKAQEKKKQQEQETNTSEKKLEEPSNQKTEPALVASNQAGQEESTSAPSASAEQVVPQPAGETPSETPVQPSAEPPEQPQETITKSESPAVNEGDLVELTPSVVKPVIASRVEPVYPRVAKGKKLQGTVLLSVLVSENGQPEQVKVLRGVGGADSLAQAAVSAVKKWTFHPAVKDGKKVKVWMTYPIVFKMQ